MKCFFYIIFLYSLINFVYTTSQPIENNSHPTCINSQFLSSPMLSKSSRQIESIVSNRLTPEGVGVTVARSIGQNPRYFNPFALLDDFRLEKNSLQKMIGFHPHPHSGISTLTYVLPTEGNGAVVHKDHKGHKYVLFFFSFL